MTFWCGSGSGSADPCHRLLDPDPDSDPDAVPDPSILINDLQDANKKLIKKKSFSAYYFLDQDITFWIRIRIRILIWIRILLFSSVIFKTPTKNYFFKKVFLLKTFEGTVHVHYFSKVKSQKEVTKQ